MPGACPRGPPGKELVLKPRQSRPTRAAPPHRPRFDVTPLGVRIGAQVRGLALDDAPRGDTLNALEDLLETCGTRRPIPPSFFQTVSVINFCHLK